MRAMDDLREQQDLGFNRSIFIPAEKRRASVPVSGLQQHAAQRAERALHSPGSDGDGREMRGIRLAQPRYRRIQPPLIARLEFLRLVQESVRHLRVPGWR